MIDSDEKIEKKVYVIAGFTKAQRTKNLENASEKWKNKGWATVKKFDGGLAKSSYLILEAQANQKTTELIEEKYVGIFLGIGIFLMPIVFSWATLRKGYSTKTKFISFIWLAIFLVTFSANDKPKNENVENTTLTESIKSSNAPAHEAEQQKVEAFTQTRKNIQLVIESLNENYGIKAKNEYQKNYCSNDKFCTIYADTVQIQAMGYIVNPLVNSQVTPSYYQQVCSAVLIALSGGANKELAEQAIVQYFNYAAQNGSARSNILGVDMRVTSNSRGLLECRFVKKW